MAAKQPTLTDVLVAIQKLDTKLSNIDKRVAGIEKRMTVIEKEVTGLKKDMKKVLNCVATENADEFPPLKFGSASRSKATLAAKAH